MKIRTQHSIIWDLLVVFLLSVLITPIFQNPLTVKLPINHTFSLSLVPTEKKISIDKSIIIPIGNKVLLQPYYWEMPDHGAYYRMLTEHMTEFAAAGFDSIWIPPPSKTEEGHHAMGGYEPYDYYDLGEYDQKGRVRTHYGTREELETLIAIANSYNIGVICDVVINHRVGGEFEINPYLGGELTPTNFMNVASGKLLMNYSHFWPNAYGSGDTKKYGTFPDISHKSPYVQSELIKWGLWLRDNIGYDGWRFDTADGIFPFMLQYWMENVTGWGVAEYWMQTPDREVINQYLVNTNNSVTAFDIPLLVELRDMANRGGAYDMRRLATEGLSKIRPNAVTYAVNHDTYRDVFNIKENRHMAYAYILTHEGYPSIFWMDWVDLNLRNQLKALIQIHNQYAKGTTSVLYVDEDIYIAQRNGDPGLIIALNDNPNDWRSISIMTKWNNTILYDQSSQSPSFTTDSHGIGLISIPPTSYVIFTPDKPQFELFNLQDIDTYIPPNEITNATIQIDGELDYKYGRPIYVDKVGDGALTPADLNNLYIKHNNTHLSIGFGYYHLREWDPSINIHFGLALDVREGGSNDDPGLHPKIRWTGLSGIKKPDIIFYFDTSIHPNDYKREINKITRYDFDNNLNSWTMGIELSSSSVSYFSSPLLGFIEFQLPLADINLEKGGPVAIKVFSSLEEFDGAYDSVPQDDTIDLSGEDISWLTMPKSVNLTISKEFLTSNHSTSRTTNLFYSDILLAVVIFSISRSYFQKKAKH